MTAAIYSLFIINKSGGLIFYKDYGSAGRMDTNDSLRLASLWHSMHAISQQLSPIVACSGIELLQADTFDLHCFQSLTDYVLKNPFYEMEMPIRCELFDLNLSQATQKNHVALLGR
ncbi:hypothetical protein AQUCO_00500607v1 [Aquilegia coerulea]|uniref:Trafficking protein particle complex subunit n=1 Tax=Aquilegia coerulea TaxID=218851 RepID=A0A2G5ESQ1_AQUCA|nr:hypothetical protein AQUCO_00500607v1 [Aquilegia coerulea]